MKKIIQLVKNFLGEIILLFGVGIFTFNFFNFSYEVGRTEGVLPKLPSLGGEIISGVLYYYSNEKITFLTLGSILIVLGILIIKNKK